MRRASLLPGLAVQAAVALLLGVAATLLVLLAGRIVTTIVLGLLLALFFYAVLTMLRVVPVRRWFGPGGRFRFQRRGGGPRNGGLGGGGGSAGVREPRRPRWPGFPPRAAEAEPEGAERTM
ncbi:MAG TPA: hypothetical protein VF116_18320 [Ktedonobacterales bacterium]